MPIGYNGSGFSAGYGALEIGYIPPANALLVTSIYANDAVVLNATTGALENRTVDLGAHFTPGDFSCSDHMTVRCFSSIAYDAAAGPYALASTPWGWTSVLFAANLTYAFSFNLQDGFTTQFVL